MKLRITTNVSHALRWWGLKSLITQEAQIKQVQNNYELNQLPH
jgi:hypothetical protein